jgi:hypothetical protein
MLKLKLSCYTPWRRLGGEEVYLLLIQDLGTRWGWVVSVTPRPHFSPEERTPGTHWTGGWVGPRADLDIEVGGKILCLCRGSNRDRPVVYPVFMDETSVDNYFTRQYIPEDNSELHPWWWRQHVPLERRSTIILHGSTSQKTILNFIPDDGGSTYLFNVGRQLFYTAVHPRRQFWTSYSPPWELELSQ